MSDEEDMDEERELRQAAPARGACATPPLRLASGGASPSPHLPALSLTLGSVRSCSQAWRLGLGRTLATALPNASREACQVAADIVTTVPRRMPKYQIAIYYI